MLTAVIPTHDSERSLVPTLSALVPGATAGLLSEVIVADAGSKDATAEVADIAGCRFLIAAGPLGVQLKTAAQAARTPWLLFLRPGTVPDVGWVEAVDRFMQAADAGDDDRAAVFRPPGPANLMQPGFGEILAMLAAAFGGRPKPAQGLLIAKRFYQAVGGHGATADAETALLSRIGRRRTAMLPVGAWPPKRYQPNT